MPTNKTNALVAVHYRLPKALYQQLQTIADRHFQSLPVILRAAAAEYAARHQAPPTGTSGLLLSWPDDPDRLTPTEAPDNRQMSLPFTS